MKSDRGAPASEPPLIHSTEDDGAALTIAGTYRLLNRIGTGGMGTVYEAEHVRLGRRFAVKMMRDDIDTSARSVQRFLREARIVASIQSEHVVSIVDCGQHSNGTPFLVTELLQGQDLRKILNVRQVLTIAEAVQLAADACRGLSAVHAKSIVHRDLKPENLFVTKRDNDEPLCKLLDFGVAKLAHNRTTEHGTTIGTACYMAPEQVLDASQVGPQADIYSVGAILFEALAGHPPHDGPNAHIAMFRAVHASVPSLRRTRPDVPGELCDVIERALSPDLRVRYASASSLEDALRPFHVTGEPAAVSQVNVRRERRKYGPRMLLLLACFAAGMVAGLAIGSTVATQKKDGQALGKPSEPSTEESDHRVAAEIRSLVPPAQLEAPAEPAVTGAPSRIPAIAAIADPSVPAPAPSLSSVAPMSSVLVAPARGGARKTEKRLSSDPFPFELDTRSPYGSAPKSTQE